MIFGDPRTPLPYAGTPLPGYRSSRRLLLIVPGRGIDERGQLLERVNDSSVSSSLALRWLYGDRAAAGMAVHLHTGCHVWWMHRWVGHHV